MYLSQLYFGSIKDTISFPLEDKELEIKVETASHFFDELQKKCIAGLIKFDTLFGKEIR